MSAVVTGVPMSLWIASRTSQNESVSAWITAFPKVISSSPQQPQRVIAPQLQDANAWVPLGAGKRCVVSIV